MNVPLGYTTVIQMLSVLTLLEVMTVNANQVTRGMEYLAKVQTILTSYTCAITTCPMHSFGLSIDWKHPRSCIIPPHHWNTACSDLCLLLRPMLFPCH